MAGAFGRPGPLTAHRRVAGSRRRGVGTGRQADAHAAALAFSWKLSIALSYPAAAAPRLRGMLASTLALVSVQVEPTKQRCARPSCGMRGGCGHRAAPASNSAPHRVQAPHQPHGPNMAGATGSPSQIFITQNPRPQTLTCTALAGLLQRTPAAQSAAGRAPAAAP